MIKPLSIAALAFAASMAHAGITPTTTIVPDPDEPSLFLGLTWTFGNNRTSDGTAGISLKILSSNEEDKVAAMAGVTYNFDGSFGCDFGVAYVDGPAVLGGSYDFCKQAVQVSIGGTTSQDDRVVTTPSPSPSLTD